MKILSNPAFANEQANPYNALLFRGVIENGSSVDEYSHTRLLTNRYDILHYHWPDGFINNPSLLKSFFRMGILLIALVICRLRKTAIIWTVHNIFPHDACYPSLAKRFLTFFSHRVDGLIFLSNHSRSQFFETYPPHNPKPATAVIVHGHYKGAYPEKMAKAASRTKLGLPFESSVLLFFGQIKPYKNIDALLSAFAGIDDPLTHLVIAGKPANENLRKVIEDAAVKNPRIHSFLSFIPDEDIPLYMAAADVAVLPYKNILNSGTVLLALSYDVPVLVPALGSMLEMQKAAGKDWIRTYDGDVKPADMAGALDHFGPAGSCEFDISPFGWDDIARQTLSLYNQARPLRG